MIILAIDPGPTKSAWLTLDTGLFAEGSHGNRYAIGRHGISRNEELLTTIRQSAAIPEVQRFMSKSPALIVIEQIVNMGMPVVGGEIFETAFWSGRFAEAARPVPFDRVTRGRVKSMICGSQRAKDPQVRQSLIDRYSDGMGKEIAVGTKRQPGQLYGVANDVWSALAVAVTYAEQLRAAA